jgi:hypothetical protein
MRQAAILAGLVMDTPTDKDRIEFITEGEASLNFCIEHGLLNESIEVSRGLSTSLIVHQVDTKKSGNGVIIVDAGGGTVDISSYAHRPSSKEFEEIAAPQCKSVTNSNRELILTNIPAYFKGSVFVTRAAEIYFNGIFSKL